MLGQHNEPQSFAALTFPVHDEDVWVLAEIAMEDYIQRALTAFRRARAV